MNEQQKPQDQQQQKEDEPLPTQPGHVMALEHYQRLAREAAEQRDSQ